MRIVSVGCNWFDTCIDRKPAGKKTTTTPIYINIILTVGARNAITAAEYGLPANRKLYIIYYIHEDFSPDIRILSPPRDSSMLHKFRADLFVFLFVWHDLDLRIPLPRFRPIWMLLVGIDHQTFYSSLQWPDESAFSCHCWFIRRRCQRPSICISAWNYDFKEVSLSSIL